MRGRWCGRRRWSPSPCPAPAARRTASSWSCSSRSSRSICQAYRASNSTRSAGAPLASLPPGRLNRPAGARRQALEQLGSVRWPLWTSSSTTGSRVSSPMPPGAAWTKGRACSPGPAARWSDDDGIDHAVFSPSTIACAVGLAAQRRRQLAEGAVVADLDLVEREVGRRGVAGDLAGRAPWRARSPRSPPAVEILATCSAPPVISARRRSRSTMHHLGQRRIAGQAEPGGDLAARSCGRRGEARLRGGATISASKALA